MPKIEELYAYIGHEKEDTNDEGLTAYMVPGLKKWVPLVGADDARMTSLKPMAQMIANRSGQTITLVKFSVRTDLETIDPMQGG